MMSFSQFSDAPYGLIEQEQPGLLPEVSEAFRCLQARATVEGMNPVIVSAYRSFDRQMVIWNRKATGKLAVLDDKGRSLDMNLLGDKEKVLAILRWSALPGASRHHWRTDFDIYDKAAVAEDYAVQLTQEESLTTFSVLHGWLDLQIADGKAEGFYRPYDIDRGGVGPELWHLSHKPSASQFMQAFSLDRYREILSARDFALKDAVLTSLDEIYPRFINLPV